MNVLMSHLNLFKFQPFVSCSCSRLSVLACSPQGSLYYWANVLRDTGVTCEGSVHVGEGSAYSITSLPGGLGSLVATNTATLHLVILPSAKSLQVCYIRPLYKNLMLCTV